MSAVFAGKRPTPKGIDALILMQALWKEDLEQLAADPSTDDSLREGLDEAREILDALMAWAQSSDPDREEGGIPA